MTRYQRDRQGIWMVQVRNKDTDQEWCVTGPDWYTRRKDCVSHIATIDWPDLEYRAVRYMPESKSNG